MKLGVRYDDREIRQALFRLRGEAPLAIARACNRSIATVQTQAVRSIAEDVGVAQREVRKVMSLRKATRETLKAILEITGKRIPLIQFKARQTKAGVSYRLPGGRSTAPGAFIATMGSGHEGVFRRRGPMRLPIDELRGPSLPHVFSKEAIRAALVRVAKDVMPKNLVHEIEFILRGNRAA